MGLKKKTKQAYIPTHEVLKMKIIISIGNIMILASQDEVIKVIYEALLFVTNVTSPGADISAPGVALSIIRDKGIVLSSHFSKCGFLVKRLFVIGSLK